jgi:pimeloyl-ACP methyl ester carboxylesterase
MTEKDLALADYSTTVRLSDFKNQFLELQKRSIGLGINAMSFISPVIAAKMALAVWGKTRMKKFIPRGIFSNVVPQFIEVENKNVATYSFTQNKFENSKGKILLVHGWEGQASDFYKIIPTLLGNGYDVLSFDGPAHGQSDSKYSHIFEFAVTIEKMASQFGPFKCVIGHSMGGASATIANYLSTHFKPEKIITIGSPNKLLTMTELFASFLNLNQVVLKSMVGEMEKLTGLKLAEVSMENYLSESKAEVMVIHDENDLIVPITRAEEIRSKVNVKRFLATRELGHVKILRNAFVTDEIVDFLESKSTNFLLQA